MSGSLDIALEGPVAVAALMSSGRFETLAEFVPDWLARGADPLDLREAAYVGALFCGFPRGVAALNALASVDGSITPPPTPASPSRAELRRVGETLFKSIHRRTAGRQLTMLERLHPDFADTVLSEAYGRVLSRPRLPLHVRELIGVASLAAQQLLPQLRAHLLGAHNTGASWELIRVTIDHSLRLAELNDPSPIHAMLETLRTNDIGNIGNTGNTGNTTLPTPSP